MYDDKNFFNIAKETPALTFRIGWLRHIYLDVEVMGYSKMLTVGN
jgi:hypothetical protein